MQYLAHIKTQGQLDKNVAFVLERQLKNRTYWKKFCEVFTTKEDTADEGWRSEYFGKMMRGAAWVYAYTRDEALYAVMTDAVNDLLSRQEIGGRFSSYEAGKALCGWDVWGRKYVLTGLLHYCNVCRDEALKARVMQALCRHLDALIAEVGGGAGQVPITETSSWWGGVNSCSVLEPVVEMYRRTGKAEYLAFAEYILSTGGCREGDLIELALSGEKLPYEYPVVKAYEIMSFFEGVLAYYEVTGKERFLLAARRFIEAVFKSEITIIGCAGCTHECFDHAVVRQTEYSDVIMQETCVTVTWMRLLSRMYCLSGEPAYLDQIERSGLNALYGSINTAGNEQYSFEREKYMPAMAFDSYSPLYMNKRGRGIGGFKEFASGGYFGCCVAIAACGIALMPLTAVMRDEDGAYAVNFLCDGVVEAEDHTLRMQGDYPRGGKGRIIVSCKGDKALAFRIRRPAWCTEMKVNGKAVGAEGYYTVRGVFRDGDGIDVEYGIALCAERRNGKIAFTYGPLVLAADALKSPRDLRLPVRLKSGAPLQYRLLPPEEGEEVRLMLSTEDGELLLTDYASCGKQWLQENAVISVWLNEG